MRGPGAPSIIRFPVIGSLSFPIALSGAVLAAARKRAFARAATNDGGPFGVRRCKRLSGLAQCRLARRLDAAVAFVADAPAGCGEKQSGQKSFHSPQRWYTLFRKREIVFDI